VSGISDLSVDTVTSPGDSKAVADILEQVSLGKSETLSRGVQQTLTLADIKAASPMEEEAHTILLQALDERESKAEVTDTILPHVPSEGMAAFEAEPVEPLPDGDQGEEQQFHEAADQVRSSNVSTKVKLIGLAKSMRLLHKDKSVRNLNTDEKVDDVQDPEEQDIEANDPNAFLKNANILFHRPAAAKQNKTISPNEEVHVSVSGDSHDLEEGRSSPLSNREKKRKRNSPKYKTKDAMTDARYGVTAELSMWHDFVQPKKTKAWKYAKWLICVLILPLLAVAAILFYAAGNPMVRNSGTSISWLCLFILRNIITFSLGKFTEMVIIDYLSLRRRFTVNVSFIVCWCQHCALLLSSHLSNVRSLPFVRRRYLVLILHFWLFRAKAGPL
jgi:hypothetical protein